MSYEKTVIEDRYQDRATVTVENDMVCVRFEEDSPTHYGISVAKMDYTPKRARKLAKALKRAARAAEQS